MIAIICDLMLIFLQKMLYLSERKRIVSCRLLVAKEVGV
jgi:hypothetical protein